MWQALGPDLDACALLWAGAELRDLKNLVEIVSVRRFDRRGLLFRRKERVTKHGLLQQEQKIRHMSPTAGAARPAKAAQRPIRCGSAPQLVTFGLDAGNPIDNSPPHELRNVNSFRIALRERQRVDGLEQRERDRLLGLQNRRYEGAVSAPNDGACLDCSAQIGAADSVQD